MIHHDSPSYKQWHLNLSEPRTLCTYVGWTYEFSQIWNRGQLPSKRKSVCNQWSRTSQHATTLVWPFLMWPSCNQERISYALAIILRLEFLACNFSTRTMILYNLKASHGPNIVIHTDISCIFKHSAICLVVLLGPIVNILLAKPLWPGKLTACTGGARIAISLGQTPAHAGFMRTCAHDTMPLWIQLVVTQMPTPAEKHALTVKRDLQRLWVI